MKTKRDVFHEGQVKTGYFQNLETNLFILVWTCNRQKRIRANAFLNRFAPVKSGENDITPSLYENILLRFRSNENGDF